MLIESPATTNTSASTSLKALLSSSGRGPPSGLASPTPTRAR